MDLNNSTVYCLSDIVDVFLQAGKALCAATYKARLEIINGSGRKPFRSKKSCIAPKILYCFDCKTSCNALTVSVWCLWISSWSSVTIMMINECQHQVNLPFKMVMVREKTLVTDRWPGHPKS